MGFTNYAGIDYGCGRSNIDEKTGIRYGVIHQHDVLQGWADESEPVYGQVECPKCKSDVDLDDICQACGHDFGYEFDCIEPIFNQYAEEGYKAFDDEWGDIMIVASPYYTYAQFCSPCAPGAVYLANPLIDKVPDNRGYCFGHDWFDNGVAPYPVYSVKTGKLVVPEVEQSK
jgi:hypothetical protein